MRRSVYRRYRREFYLVRLRVYGVERPARGRRSLMLPTKGRHHVLGDVVMRIGTTILARTA